MAHALASMETLFAFAHAGMDQAHYFNSPGAGDTSNPTYRTFEFLKSHWGGSELLNIYPTTDPDLLISVTYRGYVTQNGGTGEIILWGLNWGDEEVEIDFEVDNLNPYFTYDLIGFHELEAPSLLHGALNTTCAPTNPALTEPLTINFTEASGNWDETIDLEVTVPPYSWVAYRIERTPTGPIYSLWSPFIFLPFEPSDGSAAARPSSPPVPYPPPDQDLSSPYPTPEIDK